MLKSLLTGGGTFGGLFGGVSGSGGVLGSLFSGIGKTLGFADGGQITGPGTGRSDSILARVSAGEFVMNADATKKNLPLLHALNSGKLPAFANGGLVGSSSTAAPSLGSGGGSPAVHLTHNVTVHGNGGDQKQNADLAKQFTAQIEASTRRVVVSELMKQQRPGNILYR